MNEKRFPPQESQRRNFEREELAERVRFELTVVLPTHAFQACALNHSAISPHQSNWQNVIRTTGRNGQADSVVEIS